jgi:hypothetical protein
MENRKINNSECDNKGTPVYHDGIDCDKIDSGGNSPLKDSLWLNCVAYEVDRLKDFIENSSCFEKVKNDQGDTVGYKLKEGRVLGFYIEVYDESGKNVADRPMIIGDWGPLPTKNGKPPAFDPFDPTPKVRPGDYKPRRPTTLPLFNPDHLDSDGSDTFIPVLPEFNNAFPCDIVGGFQDDSGMYWEIFNSIYYYMNIEYENNIFRVNKGLTGSIEIKMKYTCSKTFNGPNPNDADPNLPKLGDFPSLRDVQRSMKKRGDN